MFPRVFSWLVVLAALISGIAGQTGGSFDLSHNVIATGGGSNSTSSRYTVDGTTGQPLAGVQSSNATFSVRGGFWAFHQLAPTAAGVGISGRVRTADGLGIRDASLVLTNLSNGTIVTAISSTFGYYRFEDITVGQLYSLSVSSKRYTFDQDTLVINLLDELTDVDFVVSSGSR